MNILFDTNTIIDILGRSEEFFESYASYDIVLTRDFEPFASSGSTTDIVYLLKQRGYCDKKQARLSLQSMFKMFRVLDCTSSDCKKAFESTMNDYEDALIAQAAKRSGIDFIITRNKKDFVLSPVPALTPGEFVSIYKPDYLEYEIVDF